MSGQTYLLLICFLLALAGIAWLLWARAAAPASFPPPASRVDALTPGVAATMDSLPFAYSAGWQVAANGADPGEPADPWTEPAGVVEFDYSGKDLALQLATGDYWGYLYVTVDGAPATALPVIRGNTESRGMAAGYKPLYDPDSQTATQPSPIWLTVHRSAQATDHHVRIEVWRSWGQTPLRAVAVDALPTEPLPTWPGVLLVVGAVWLGAVALVGRWGRSPNEPKRAFRAAQWATRQRQSAIGAMAALGTAMVVLGTASGTWWLCLPGLALLGLASLVRPALWLAAVLFGLPFYFGHTLPLLPMRSFSLIDVGVFGGLVVWLTSIVLGFCRMPTFEIGHNRRTWAGLALAAIVGWALVATAAAQRQDVALHEWRTLFLAAGAFALLLTGVLGTSRSSTADRRLLLAAWLAGATAVAAIGLWHFAGRSMLIEAEGVTRIRAVYGSPNNLALYLERALAVTLALGLFLRDRRTQLIWLLAAALQGAALLLTFSKGALLLGLPALFAVLWLGGLRLLRDRAQSTRPLWILAGLALLGLLALTPFLGTERFTRLFDLSQGTGFLRLQLWRSSWQMALDHLPLGVGPDNFLYAYRSGYILPEAWQEPNLNHPHNWLLDWWTRLGLPGLALGLLFWGAGIAVLWQRFRQGAGEVQVWALGFLAATAAALAHGLIDLSYALPDLMIVWVMLFFLVGSDRPAAAGSGPDE